VICKSPFGNRAFCMLEGVPCAILSQSEEVMVPCRRKIWGSLIRARVEHNFWREALELVKVSSAVKDNPLP
jgi:hypothetical protein